MKFEYLYTLQPEKELELEDIGNVCLYGHNGLEEFVLILKTDLGETQMISYGPNLLDIDQPPQYSSCSYARFQFSEARIIKTIDNFLNGKSALTYIEVVPFEDAIKYIKNFTEYLL